MTKNVIKAHWLKHAPALIDKMIEADEWDLYMIVPKVFCADGFCMSVQANNSDLMTVKASGNYKTWEIGLISEEEPLIMEYAGDSSDPTGTTYGYVPTDIVNAIITKHGGIRYDQT